jgi:hypothetical protein
MANASFGNSIGGGKGSGSITAKSVGLGQDNNWTPVGGVKVGAAPDGAGVPPKQDTPQGKVAVPNKNAK